MYGYYGQGVSLDTAVLPLGWRDRVVAFRREDADPSDARCLEPHDLVVAKLVAGREKDVEFTTALLEARLVSAEILYERADALDQVQAVRHRVQDLITRCVAKSGGT